VAWNPKIFSFHEMMHVHINPRQDKYQNIPGVEQVKFYEFFFVFGVLELYSFMDKNFGKFFSRAGDFFPEFIRIFPNLWEFP
jgi:hypothetical protein